MSLPVLLLVQAMPPDPGDEGLDPGVDARPVQLGTTQTSAHDPDDECSLRLIAATAAS